MISVGYDLYLKLLEEAVLEERGEPSPDTEVCYHCERKEACRKTRDQKCF